ncbi:MAG: integrase, partial [Acidimicrobiales bacterium]
DFDARGACLHVRPRRNANGARVKGQRHRTVPVPASVMRLYADYMHEEYGDLDSDYVFVTLWREPVGRPLRRSAVDDLFVKPRSTDSLSTLGRWSGARSSMSSEGCISMIAGLGPRTSNVPGGGGLSALVSSAARPAAVGCA